MIDMNQIVGSKDILLITLDTLRYDVAQAEWQAGHLPNIGRHLSDKGWEKRHAPGSFTYASHQAIFAGFLPTPHDNPKEPRLFALDFLGSETTGPKTCRFQEETIIAGLRAKGYKSLCIGGVGFFNQQTPLGEVMPNLFDESHWDDSLGVTDPDSSEHQVDLALAWLQNQPTSQRLFLFLNISAIHQPNRGYLPGADRDNLQTHAAALRYVDQHLGRLFAAQEQRGPAFVILCSDHGTAYGEDGHEGHRLAHEVVWTVPYTHFQLGQAQ
jgi:hypothetical protein